MFPKYIQCITGTFIAASSSVLTLKYIITDNNKNIERLKSMKLHK